MKPTKSPKKFTWCDTVLCKVDSALQCFQASSTISGKDCAPTGVGLKGKIRPSRSMCNAFRRRWRLGRRCAFDFPICPRRCGVKNVDALPPEPFGCLRAETSGHSQRFRGAPFALQGGFCRQRHSRPTTTKTNRNSGTLLRLKGFLYQCPPPGPGGGPGARN